MKVLLVGGAGYIGSHTAVSLIEAGHEVVILDNFSNSDRSVLERLRQITAKDIRLIEADVLETQRLTRAISENGVDAVMHFAGLKAVGESAEKPLLYFKNNVAGTISLLEAMDQSGVKTFVFSSSATVYGAPVYLPYDEEHPTKAVNPYGRTKLHIEEMLRDVASSDEAWKIANLRYFNPVGAHGSGLIGDDPNGIPNNLMPYIARVAMGLLPRLNVFGDDYDTPDGTGVRDYIHVVDLAAGHLAALDWLGQNAGWHAFNLGTGEGTSVLQMIRAFEDSSDRHIPYVIRGRRPGDIASSLASPRKANELLNWSTRQDLVSMCGSSWQFILNRYGSNV